MHLAAEFKQKDISNQLADVVQIGVDSLKQTSLAPIMEHLGSVVCSGKMLRSRLILRIGTAAGLSFQTLSRLAASVELIHAASLLHDDVIDGSQLRRGSPTFWLQKGVSGSILVGDLLICRAVSLVMETGNNQVLGNLVKTMEEMCNAEVEQELLCRGTNPGWEERISVARRKTGSLFAFASSVCGGTNELLSSALMDSGYAVGTAYQLADDVLDVCGDPVLADKTLGSDAGRSKPTTFLSGMALGDNDPLNYINSLCERSLVTLVSWPDIYHVWQSFLNEDIYPCIRKYVDHYHVAV